VLDRKVKRQGHKAVKVKVKNVRIRITS